MVMIRNILIFTFLWKTLFLTAQSTLTHFDYLTISEGLPHNTVFCSLQDKNGFMWFGTQDGLARYDGYECRIFKQNDSDASGFKGKSIHSLLEDKKGNLWVGTQTHGINFRDVKTGEFKNLGNEVAFKSISKNWINSIMEDEKGLIWIGSAGAGILVYDPQTNKSILYNSNNSHLHDNFIVKILQDENGRVWIATNGLGIYYFDEKTQDFISIHSISNEQLAMSYEPPKIREGSKLKAQGSRLNDDTDFESFRKTLYSDKKGHLWIGTEGSGLYKIDLSTLSITRFTIQNGLSSNNIMGIAENASGELLLATDGGGLNILNLKTNHFSNIMYDQTKDLINTNALLNILIDVDDNIWLGTYNGGVNIYKAHKTWFETLTRTGLKTGELTHRSVLSICKTSTGDIFVGTDGGGLNQYNKRNKTFTFIPNNPIGFGNVVKTIFEDRQKRLWLGYFNDGLSRFYPQTKKFEYYKRSAYMPLGLSGNNVWSIEESANGKLEIGILGGGVSFVNSESTVLSHQLSYVSSQSLKEGSHEKADSSKLIADVLSSNDVIHLFEDKNQQLWIGTATQGLNLLDSSKKHITQFLHQNNNIQSISADDIRCIFQDSKGRLWIGTESGGLNLWLGNGKFQHFTTQNGLISNAVMAILEDKDGFLWISTFNGLSRLQFSYPPSAIGNQSLKLGTNEKADSRKLIADSPKLLFILNFDFHRNAHAINNQFNQGSALADEDGTLYFGGINGFTIVEPHSIPAFDKKPRIAFTDFKIFNTSISPLQFINGHKILNSAIEQTSEISIPYKENVFSLEFSALDFTDPYKNKFQNQLVGFDPQWISSPRGQRSVTYTNLDPGTYWFKVKGSNSYGTWSDEKAIKIIITPPFWKTWLFKLFILAIIVITSWLGLKIILKRREMALKQKILESESSLLAVTNEKLSSDQIVLNLQNEKLANEIKSKNAELMAKAAQMANKNESLLNIKEQIEEITSSAENDREKRLKKLKSTLNIEIESEKSWEQFILYFDEVNQNFTTVLLKKHPQLTQNDLRMCALTRLNMSNKEMANLLGITVTGVEKSRYRLKKRLELKQEDNLDDYLRKLVDSC